MTPPEQPQTKEGLFSSYRDSHDSGGILILLLLLLLLMEKRRRRRKADEYVDSPNMYAVEEEARAPETEAPPVNVLNTEAGLQMQAENAEMERNEEILNLRCSTA